VQEENTGATEPARRSKGNGAETFRAPAGPETERPAAKTHGKAAKPSYRKGGRVHDKDSGHKWISPW